MEQRRSRLPAAARARRNDADRDVRGDQGRRTHAELRRHWLYRTGRCGRVRVWQFNDAFGAQTVEQTSPTISHTFPSAGAYSIGLTVFASDGLSTGTGGIVATGHNGVSRGFTFSPSRPDRGETVTFSGLFTTMSAQQVLVYLWQFGDGSTGSGVGPTHRYARPGIYVVTLVMFSGVGSAFPGAGAGPIVKRTITVRS